MPNFRNMLLVTIAAFGLAVPAIAAAPDINTVVATVDGTKITLGQLIMMTSQLPKQYRSMPDDVLYKAVLDQVIRQVAVAKTIEGHLSKAAQLALKNQRLSFLASEALQKAAQGAVTDAVVQKAYDAEYAAAATGTEYNAAHILVATEDEAKAIKAELDGGADFAAIAREKSTGPSGPSGGDLGWFSKGMMVKPFEDAVIKMQPGDVSDPVQTKFGWHVIKLIKTRDKSAPALADVRDKIVAKLQQAAVSAAIEDITAKADVQRAKTEIDPSVIRNMDLLNN